MLSIGATSSCVTDALLDSLDSHLRSSRMELVVAVDTAYTAVPLIVSNSPLRYRTGNQGGADEAVVPTG